jgi:hypothetical protein
MAAPTTTSRSLRFVLAAGCVLAALPAQQQPAPARSAPPGFEQVAGDVRQQLEQSLAELAALRERVAAEKIPMAQDLRELDELRLNARTDLQRALRTQDARNLDLTNLTTTVERGREQAAYLANLFADHGRNFEARLHIGELQRYEATLGAARLARDNPDLPRGELFAAELKVLEASLDRAADVLGGARFDGTAVDPTGLVRPGAFLVVGPTALFRSADGQHVGAAEQRLARSSRRSCRSRTASTRTPRRRSCSAPAVPCRSTRRSATRTSSPLSRRPGSSTCGRAAR